MGIENTHYSEDDVSLINCFDNGDLLFKGRDYFKILTISHEAHGNNRLGSHIYNYYAPHPCLYSYAYTESLVSVKGMNPMHTCNVESDLWVITNSKRSVRLTGGFVFFTIFLFLLGCSFFFWDKFYQLVSVIFV